MSHFFGIVKNVMEGILSQLLLESTGHFEAKPVAAPGNHPID
jgi:hypothetical protein